MKKCLTLLAVLLIALLPLCALAELKYEIQDEDTICFPELNGLTGHFVNASSWTFVTSENLEEHLDMVLARGGTEEEVRERYARESFVFEAYSPVLPADACIRVETFTNDLTRTMWNVKHMDVQKKEAFFEEVEMGMVMPWYEIYDGKLDNASDTSIPRANFTSIPPASLESGTMRFPLINGTMYVVSYCVSGRLAGRAELFTAQDAVASSPVTQDRDYMMLFTEEKLPQLPAFSLKSALPTQADVGDLTVTGSIREGGTLVVTLDGVEVPTQVKGNGQFTVTLPLTEEGEREIVFTTSHPRNTTRVETFFINVSSIRTKLSFSEVPVGYVLPGKQVVSGLSDPGATISFTLDEDEPILITADEKGNFTHTFDLPDTRLHHLLIMATAPDYKDTFKVETYFYTLHATFMEGMQSFGSKIVKAQVKDIARAPADYVGERVMINVHIESVEVTELGLGMKCRLILPGFLGDDLYAYVTVYGYAQCVPHADMEMTIYGTIEEPVDLDGTETLHVLMQYATYSYY